MMRQCFDIEERDRATREQVIMKEAGFTRAEVEEFRLLFKRGSDERTELSFSEFEKMIAGVCPLGQKYRNQLAQTFAEVAGDEADFPEFLQLLHRLLRMHFANLKEHTKEAAKKAAQCAQ